MRPKRTKEHGQMMRKPNFSNRARINSLSTLNTPDSKGSISKSSYYAGSNKRVQDVKNGGSDLLARDYKSMSMSTGKSGKSTERTHSVNKAPNNSRNNEKRPGSGEKLNSNIQKYQQNSYLNVNTLHQVDSKSMAKDSLPPKQSIRAITKSKVTSIRTRPSSFQNFQSSSSSSPNQTPPKSRSERLRPSTVTLNNNNKKKKQ